MAAIQKENTAPQHLAGQIQIAEKEMEPRELH